MVDWRAGMRITASRLRDTATPGTIVSRASYTSTEHFASEQVLEEAGSLTPISTTFTADAGRLYKFTATIEAVDKNNNNSDDDSTYGSKGQALLYGRYESGSAITTSSTEFVSQRQAVFDNGSQRASGITIVGWLAPSSGQTTVGLTGVANETPSECRLLYSIYLMVEDAGAA